MYIKILESQGAVWKGYRFLRPSPSQSEHYDAEGYGRRARKWTGGILVPTNKEFDTSQTPPRPATWPSSSQLLKGIEVLEGSRGKGPKKVK